ncbi:DUF2185 domain-containing protein [Vibrio neptunius]
MKFREDYGVWVCPHVFKKTRPILLSVRDYDGSWQFLCGLEGCVESGEPHHVGIGHLLSEDSTLDELTIMEPGSYAERKSLKSKWSFGNLED